MTKKEKMFSLVESWRESGLNREVFCHQNEIKPSTLSYWAAKQKEETPCTAEGFTRLQPPRIDSGYEITYPSGVKLHVKNADLATLSQLLRL